jgi:urease accessory protein
MSMFEANSLGFLSALQLADSFFPTGMYAHSQGLEGMVHRGLVSSPSDVEEFQRNQFTWSVLPSDGVALLNSHRSAIRGDLATILAIDQLLSALKLPSELRAVSVQVGHRLLDETVPFVSHRLHGDYRAKVATQEAPGNGAVALGVVAFSLNIPEEPALMVFCHSHATSVLGAALRLLPMTHVDAQGIQHRLHSLLMDQIQEIRERSWEEIIAFTPELDVAAMGHESDELRMFAS